MMFTCSKYSIIYYTFLHKTHQYRPQGLDSSGSKWARFCFYAFNYIMNCDTSMNFNQEYFNIALATPFRFIALIKFSMYFNIVQLRSMH